MPGPTQNITLTATLDSIIGAAGVSGFLEITLCNFGLIPPSADDVMLADAGVPQIQTAAQAAAGIKLFGNDQITPAGTYYSIAILDQNKNVIQAANYLLTGGPATVDLSTLVPVIVPAPGTPSGYVVINPATGNVFLRTSGWAGPIVFDLTLTGNAILIPSGFFPGQLVQLIIRQNAVGGWTCLFNIEFKNAAAVQVGANSVSTQSCVADDQGNIYPQLGWQ